MNILGLTIDAVPARSRWRNLGNSTILWTDVGAIPPLRCDKRRRFRLKFGPAYGLPLWAITACSRLPLPLDLTPSITPAPWPLHTATGGPIAHPASVDPVGLGGRFTHTTHYTRTPHPPTTPPMDNGSSYGPTDTTAFLLLAYI